MNLRETIQAFKEADETYRKPGRWSSGPEITGNMLENAIRFLEGLERIERVTDPLRNRSTTPAMYGEIRIICESIGVK